MAPRPFVPPELTAGPIHRKAALATGLTADQLRSRCWTRLFHEVYIHSAVPVTDDVRFEALRLAMPPEAVLTGLTAAWLYGAWTPPPGAPVPLHVATPISGRRFSPMGARAHRLVLDGSDLNEWKGIPVTDPERTCFDLMGASSPTEAVVFADAFLHAGLLTQRGLLRYADERPHWSHVRKVRDAAHLARAAAASPMESRLRMVIVFGGLMEPPLLNEPLYSPDGTFLGIPDFAYLHPLFGIEYDGAYHDTPDQHDADNVRENRLLLGNVPLLRYGADDVYRRPQRIIHEVSTMLRRAS